MPQEKIFNAKAVNLNYLDWRPSSAEPFVLLHEQVSIHVHGQRLCRLAACEG